jgi:hypothetical protein
MTSISAKWSKNIINDLSEYTSTMMSGIFQYKCKNDFEKSVLEKYLDIDTNFSNSHFIYYSMLNLKIIRKIKLKILENNEISILLKFVLENSDRVPIDTYMEMKLSMELSKSIDKDILNKLRNYVDSQDLH